MTQNTFFVKKNVRRKIIICIIFHIMLSTIIYPKTVGFPTAIFPKNIHCLRLKLIIKMGLNPNPPTLTLDLRDGLATNMYKLVLITQLPQ